MNKPSKPYRWPIEDYRCFELAECVKENNGCENCSERDTCREFQYYDLTSITLAELNEAYKDYDPDTIEIRSVYVIDRNTSLEIRRPQTEEEFAPSMKKYEEELKEWEEWKKNNTPEKRAERKKQKEEERKVKKLAKLQAEMDKLKGG